jgi:succinoglycan biosynthesis transport protein ExoP
LGDIPIDSSSVDSQAEILRSDNVGLSVLKNLHLTEDPEFVNSGGGLIGAILGFLANPFGPAETTVASETDLTRRALGVYKSGLTVKRIGLTYVIDIAFQSLNPERSATIANAVADAYIVDQLEAKYTATRRAGVWLQDRIRELRDQASTAQRAVVDFKTKNNIVESGGRLMDEQQVAELNSQLVIVQGLTGQAKARLDRIETVIRADTPDATVNSTVADSLNNSVITKLRSQYLELANTEAIFSARYGRNHLAPVNLRNQMREIRNSILDELRRIAESYKSDYQIALQREESTRKKLQQAVAQSHTANKAQVTLRELESASQTYKALYDNFLQRYMESVQQQSFPITDARVISAAVRPYGKSSPRTLLILALSTVGGVILGIGIGTLRELSDRVYRTSAQIESQLGTDCIALVPLMTGETTSKKRKQKGPGLKNLVISVVGALGLSQKSKPDESRIIVRNRSVLWTVVHSPFSHFTESIRAIKLAADLNGVVKSNKAVGFTSSLPNEGKSTIAAALAQIMSQSGRSTILVDFDIRNPSLSRQLTPKAKAGILEVIAGDLTLEDVVWKDPQINMTFLPVVSRSRVAHSSDIISSDATKKLFDQLRRDYEYIVLDLPPVAPIVDVRATTHLVDSYVYVVEWGRTKISVVEHALGVAQGVFENLLGVVLNKTDMNVLARYESNRESYYYNKNYARYGYTDK